MNELYIEPITYRFNPDAYTYTVIACDKTATEVAIPAEIDGVPVVAIAPRAFSECGKLVKVTLPSGYEDIYESHPYACFDDIGEYAFDECYSLFELTVPWSVVSIGRGAFRCCKSLTRVTFSDGIYVGAYAFYQCESLTEVTKVKNPGEGAFSQCKSLSYFPVSAATKYIDEDAFEHCYALTDVVIPANVTRIGSLAFRNCHGLKTVKFESPEGWYGRSRYFSVPDYELDLHVPSKNAYTLRTADFDDGGSGWYKKTK